MKEVVSFQRNQITKGNCLNDKMAWIKNTYLTWGRGVVTQEVVFWWEEYVESYPMLGCFYKNTQ